MSCIIAIEVAIPACGLFIIDEATAAPPTIVLGSGVDDMDDITSVVAMIIGAIVEEVVMVPLDMPFMPGIFAISIFAFVPR